MLHLFYFYFYFALKNNKKTFYIVTPMEASNFLDLFLMMVLYKLKEFSDVQYQENDSIVGKTARNQTQNKTCHEKKKVFG